MLYFPRQPDNKYVTMAHFIVHSVTLEQILIIFYCIEQTVGLSSNLLELGKQVMQPSINKYESKIL